MFFSREFYTSEELQYCQARGESRQAERLAARYAAKEAFIKALDGPRLWLKADLKINFREIEIRNDDSGRPFFRFHGELKKYLETQGIRQASVSLSHTGDYAVAQVVILSDDARPQN